MGTERTPNMVSWAVVIRAGFLEVVISKLIIEK